MVTARLYTLYRRFRGTTGQHGRDAAESLAMAKAVMAAQANGWCWDWVDDPDGMPTDGLCTCGCGAAIESCQGCILYDEDGMVLESLWGIWDADAAYRRIVEAQLAQEALP